MLKDIQKAICQKGADAWIVVDYENRNPSVEKLLGHMMLTRKVFVVIPKSGKPYIICHSIDSVFLKRETIASRFELKIYRTWEEMLDIEKTMFSPYRKVLMDVSENGLLPRVSLADYGSVKFIEGLGATIDSSADILQVLNAKYGPRSYELQLKADKLALKIKDEAFEEIGRLIKANGETDEYAIQRFICRRFHEEGMIYDEAPIVAIGENAKDPHYGPTEKAHSKIKEGNLVLIDMWAKMDDPEAVYADITWMGYVGSQVPNALEERFQILRKACDEAIAFLEKEIPNRPVMGYEVDKIARSVIEKSGYGEYFVHRTGHNISVDVSPHGPGANIDDFESHDTRTLIDGTSFSIEPGIYAPDFGMRSETNVYIDGNHPVVVAGRQSHIVLIKI